MELLNKERKWMKKLHATLNQRMPGKQLTLGETEYQKQYREQNKNKLDDYQKQYRERNKKKLDDYQKQYREHIECECGCVTSHNHISRHGKAKKKIKK